MNKARMIDTSHHGFKFTKVIRGKLHDKDKHWGMRSNMEFRKILEAKK